MLGLMLKKIFFSLLVLMLLTTGCGIFNLTNFVMPDDLEFIAVVESLDTPEKIGNYMTENFTYKIHGLYASDPYTLWKIKEGDCNDFSTFGTFVANYHGYETYQIEIYYGTMYAHYLGVYVEDMYSFTDNRSYHYGFNTFKDIVNESEKYTGLQWKSYIVYDYFRKIIKRGINE